MWVALIIAVITYLLQNPGNSEERKKALLVAAGAGAVTYGVTQYTDWGQENLAPLDSSISSFVSGNPDSSSKVTVAGGAGQNATGTTTVGTGFWDTLKSWGPAGTLAVGAGASALAGSRNWLLPLAIGVGAFAILS